ncbi:hypothetical protein EUGRSUZ_A00588 [Eucalyptus grandis]|uniref:Uncharacterized protein n=2 Tax=Eucalyptus grandis TaxID=71139 RepID=A0ACC3M224_EUCGR|nr:hypothetical protein EUGRSUZ_A00588 [Eucalyptus grandis]
MFYLETPFKCSIEDCSASYRRKDHLARHFLQHKGKIFSCPVDGCNKSFAYQGNMKRHLNEIHNDEEPSTSGECNSLKQHVCSEVGCGKVFKFASKLQKHEDSYVKLETVEAFCCECMKYFSNVDYLKDHMRLAHQLVNCNICGTKQLRKNIQRHLLTHEKKNSADSEAFRCEVEGCLRIFSIGDFEELDEQFQSRPRGRRKRKCPTIESLLRKRVTLPNELDFLLD